MPQVRLALAQLNLTVGDVAGNTQRLSDTAIDARERLNADLLLCPELALCGYPRDDLLFHNGLRRQISAAVARLHAEVQGIRTVFGYPQYEGDAIYNAVLAVRNGKTLANYRK